METGKVTGVSRTAIGVAGLRAMESARPDRLLAAGLDTRTFRLDWPAGVRPFELDLPEVLDYKARVLVPAGLRTGTHDGAALAEGYSRAHPNAGSVSYLTAILAG